MSVSVERLQLRPKGKLATTGNLNKVIQAVNRLNPDEEFGPQQLPLGSGWLFIGEVTDAGPTGEAAYTDEREWVKVSFIKSASVVTTAVDLKPYVANSTSCPTASTIVTVTNLSGRISTTSAGSGRHNIPKGTYVIVYGVVDAGGKVRFVTVPGGSSSLPTPRPKYSVLQAINTTEDVAFDGPRFQ